MDHANYEDVEVDPGQYLKVFARGKKIFFSVFLAVLLIGVCRTLLSPEMYRVSMMIQPPVVGPSLTGANDLEPAESLKGLIVNGVYSEELKRISGLDKRYLDFRVTIPEKTNILKVSVDLDKNKKDQGVALLQGLVELISKSYLNSMNVRISDINDRIKLNERAILSAKEKAENLKAQIDEVNASKDRLREELRSINQRMEQILEKREHLLKQASSESSYAIFLANYIQNNSGYMNQINNQLSELSMQKIGLDLDRKNIDVQVINYEAEIDKLKMEKGFISNVKIIVSPKVSSETVGPDKKRGLLTSLAVGLFLGVVAVFLNELRFPAPETKKSPA